MQKLLGIDEVSAILGVTKATIYSWTSKNRIPHIKLGRRLLKFKEDDIIAWIDKRSVRPEPPLSRGSRKRKRPKASLKIHHDSIERIIDNAKKEVLKDVIEPPCYNRSGIFKPCLVPLSDDEKGG